MMLLGWLGDKYGRKDLLLGEKAIDCVLESPDTGMVDVGGNASCSRSGAAFAAAIGQNRQEQEKLRGAPISACPPLPGSNEGLFWISHDPDPSPCFPRVALFRVLPHRTLQ